MSRTSPLLHARFPLLERQKAAWRWLAEGLGSRFFMRRYFAVSQRLTERHRQHMAALFAQYGVTLSSIRTQAEAADQLGQAIRETDRIEVQFLAFFQSQHTGLIRIDAVDSVRDARTMLETATADRLDLLGFQINTTNLDTRLRRRVQAHRADHPAHPGDVKWFHPSPAVLACVEEFRVQFDMDTI